MIWILPKEEKNSNEKRNNKNSKGERKKKPDMNRNRVNSIP